MICKVIRRFFALVLLSVVGVSVSNRTFAQVERTHGTYKSEIDNLLTIEKVTVLPFTDNLQGIYARPLEAHFISIVDKMHRWDYIPANNTGAILTPDELEQSPEKTLQVSSGLGVDAFFAGRITKGPNGITVHISFFLAKDGKLLSQAILKDYKIVNLPDIKEQQQRLLQEIVSRIPYSGRVMSREGHRVTVNLGLRDGLQNGQMLSVIQVIKAERHPKFNFLVRTEKEIFGKIKVLKVDETLSFGTVITEKEKGAIQKNSKIGPLDFVVYSGNQDLSLSGSPEAALADREDGRIAFGKDPSVWAPEPPPTFGQIGARVGLSQVQVNRSPVTGPGVSSTDNFAPSVLLEGEIWITQEFTFHARLKQSIITLNDASTGKVNRTQSAYEAGFGYMFRFGPYIWSPNVEPFLGYFTSCLCGDANVFPSMEYNGFKFGVRGSAPIGMGNEFGAGGEMSFAWRPGMRELPHSSGASSTNNVLQFGAFAFKKMGERMKLQGQIDFDMFSSNFSGTGSGGAASSASSASHRSTTLSAGLYYMF